MVRNKDGQPSVNIFDHDGTRVCHGGSNWPIEAIITSETNKGEPSRWTERKKSGGCFFFQLSRAFFVRKSCLEAPFFRSVALPSIVKMRGGVGNRPGGGVVSGSSGLTVT